MSSLEPDKVKQALLYFNNIKDEKKNIVSDYKKQNISDKIVKIIMSLIGFINENNYKR